MDSGAYRLRNVCVNSGHVSLSRSAERQPCSSPIATRACAAIETVIVIGYTQHTGSVFVPKIAGLQQNDIIAFLKTFERLFLKIRLNQIDAAEMS